MRHQALACLFFLAASGYALQAQERATVKADQWPQVLRAAAFTSPGHVIRWEGKRKFAPDGQMAAAYERKIAENETEPEPSAKLLDFTRSLKNMLERARHGYEFPMALDMCGVGPDHFVLALSMGTSKSQELRKVADYYSAGDGLLYEVDESLHRVTLSTKAAKLLSEAAPGLPCLFLASHVDLGSCTVEQKNQGESNLKTSTLVISAGGCPTVTAEVDLTPLRILKLEFEFRREQNTLTYTYQALETIPTTFIWQRWGQGDRVETWNRVSLQELRPADLGRFIYQVKPGYRVTDLTGSSPITYPSDRLLEHKNKPK